MNVPLLADRLRELAAEGITQAEAARRLGLTRSRISFEAMKRGIVFTRLTRKLEEIVCPRCNKIRKIRPSDALRRKSTYCKRCVLTGMNLRPNG